MIHGYHVIFAAYGFWLPNDPRGSWSDFVGKWELIHFGRSTKAIERLELTAAEEQSRLEAKQSLAFPAVEFTGIQAQAIGESWGDLCRRRNYSIWSCSILPTHVHLVIARHAYQVESIVNLLKGQATRRLMDDGLHPLSAHAQAGKRPPRMWAKGCWKVYLDSETAIENAVRYVEENPVREGKPRQRWRFVAPFRGLDPGWVTYH